VHNGSLQQNQWEAPGVQTSHGDRVSAIIIAVQIASGIALTMAGAHARQSKN
jgi:hypothetical protein